MSKPKIFQERKEKGEKMEATITRTRFTPEMKSRSERLLAEGITPKVVSQNIGVSITTLKRHGLVAVKKRDVEDIYSCKSLDKLTRDYKRELYLQAIWHERKAKTLHRLIKALEDKIEKAFAG